jgi:cold shock protein
VAVRQTGSGLFCGDLYLTKQLIYVSSMKEGTIARITDRGFGFIASEGEEKDIFFHSNDLVGVEFNDLKEGDAVTFEVADGPKGPSAVKVSRKGVGETEAAESESVETE